MLNTDVDNSKSKTIEERSREELGNLSVIFWQDQYFVENNQEDASLVEENKYRDYYQGYTSLQFPQFNPALLNLQYHYETSKTSGSVKTAWYGQSFDPNKFEDDLFCLYFIYFPGYDHDSSSNINTIAETIPGLTFVLDFYMDVGLYPGMEYVWISDIRKDSENYEPLTLTGNVSVTRKYNNTNKMFGGKLIWFIRRLDKELVEKSVEKRNTGFQLSWYYEDGDGNRVDIEQDAYHKQETNNKRFIIFMNLIYEAVTKHGISFDSLWETSKRYRLDYINRTIDYNVGNCICGMIFLNVPALDLFSLLI